MDLKENLNKRILRTLLISNATVKKIIKKEMNKLKKDIIKGIVKGR